MSSTGCGRESFFPYPFPSRINMSKWENIWKNILLFRHLVLGDLLNTRVVLLSVEIFILWKMRCTFEIEIR